MLLVFISNCILLLIKTSFYISNYQILYTFVSYLNNYYFNYFFLYFIFRLFKYKKIIYNYLYTHWLSFFLTIKKYQLLKIPNQLLIGYNNIHPILLYISFLFFFYFFFKYIFYKIFYIFNISVISLFLGSLWGSGNSIWGFFWVNDKIELYLFFYCLLLLKIIHVKNSLQQKYLVICLLLIIIFNIYLLRIGFNFTRHNFFDIKKTINFSVFSIFLLVNLFFFYYLFFIIIFYYIFYYLILLYFISIIQKKIFDYRLISIYTHYFLLLLFIFWLKTKEHNYLIISNNNNHYILVNYLFNINFYFNNFLIFFKIKKTILYLNIYNLYSFKIFFFKKKIFILYSKFLIIISSLISICKIYVWINTKISLVYG